MGGILCAFLLLTVHFLEGFRAMRWLVAWEKCWIHEKLKTANSLPALSTCMYCNEVQSRTTSTPLWAVVMHTYKVFIMTEATKCLQPIDNNQPWKEEFMPLSDTNQGPCSLSRTCTLSMLPPVDCLKSYDIWSRSTKKATVHVPITMGRNALRLSNPHCALFGWIHGDEMTGCVGEVLDSQSTWDC